MADTEINIKLKGLGEIRKELKTLRYDLSQATDPEEMGRLAERAGELTDNLKRANEQTAIFAAGSPFERTNNALGMMGSQLMSLDFEGASESAKLFATAAKGINGEQIATQLKGLGGVVGGLGKGFMSLGKTILLNPIFLIAAAVVAIIAILAALASKLGILKPIMKAVGEVFKAIGKAIDLVVQSIKDFLDWLGLTSFAAEEAAARQQAAFEKVAEAREKELSGTVQAYDRKIELAKIEGKNTTQMEREKQLAIAETQAARYRDLVAALDAAKRKGDVDNEEIKKLKEKAVEAKKAAGDARWEIVKINKQEEVDNEKKNGEIEKSNNESYKKRLEQQKQYAADRLAAERSTKDLQLELMQEGIDKELAMNEEKYKRLIADTLKNEKLLASEKETIVKLLQEQQFEAEKAIQQTFTDELTASVEQATANRKAKEAEDQASFLELTNEAIAKRKEQKDKQDAEDLAKAQAKAAALQSIEQSLFSGLASLGTIFINDQKKLEKFNKASALVQIGIDTAKAISALVANSQANPTNAVTGGLAGIAQFASGLASILANVAKAKQLLTSPGASVSAGGSGGGGASTQSTQPITPQVNLFGQNNNANNLSGAKSMENTMIVKAYVSETDMTDTQKKVGKIKEAASL